MKTKIKELIKSIKFYKEEYAKNGCDSDKYTVEHLLEMLADLLDNYRNWKLYIVSSDLWAILNYKPLYSNGYYKNKKEFLTIMRSVSI